MLPIAIEPRTPPQDSRGGGRAAGSSRDRHAHRVQFYDSEGFLCDVVGEYLGRGLAAGEGLVVIATEPHRRAFQERLARAGHAVGDAVRAGQLTLLDARETLAAFMVDGLPDRVRFRATIAPVLDASRAAGPHAPVRAYGEMVDLLIKDGNAEGALALEEAWNEVGSEQALVLLCAYAMGGFSTRAVGQTFDRICQAHTHVTPAEDCADDGDPETLRRQVTRLQQRTRALESEVACRRALEGTLRAREGELADFLENAVEGLHWVGPDGRILWANQAELSLLGYRRDEYIGHHIREFHADPAVVDEMMARLGRRETLREFEARMRCKDGSLRDVLVSSNALFRDGQFVHTRCFTRDITDRRRLDHELQRQNEVLSRQLRFSEMFVGMLGHDLRNPVSAVMAGAALLMRRSKDDAVLVPARRVLSSAERMGRMIDQLLDFTRLRLGQGLPIERRSTDLARVCRSVIDELQGSGAAGRIGLVAAGDTAGAWDPDLLGQLLSNLIGNALVHGSAGAPIGVHLDGSAREALQIEVINAGAIPADLLPIIFEPFRTSADKKGERSSGLGLGLYIGERIVAAHGGTIGVTSTAADGTRFTIRLPRNGLIDGRNAGSGRGYDEDRPGGR